VISQRAKDLDLALFEMWGNEARQELIQRYLDEERRDGTVAEYWGSSARCHWIVIKSAMPGDIATLEKRCRLKAGHAGEHGAWQTQWMVVAATPVVAPERNSQTASVREDGGPTILSDDWGV